MTTRLNNDHRNVLLSLARKVAEETLDSTVQVKKFKTELAELARPIVLKEFPIEDMKILRKYEVASYDFAFRFVHDGSSDIFQVRFDYDIDPKDYASDKEYKKAHEAMGIIVPDGYNVRSRILKASKKLSDTRHAYEKLKNKHQADYTAMFSRYAAIIQHYKTYESLVEVWPEAATVSAAIRANLPAVISNEIIEQIKAESEARMKKLTGK